jgi:hypothetical protein
MNANERIQTRFREIYVEPRERHDDFADQTDDAGIGATRYRARSLHVSQAGILQAGILYVTT